ncbi:MAG: aminodeoxychorismate/anthranilate synthase component II [Planctomycetaceae bacterium]|nr:aminodeoxychorismate/anthranilate synthase component II [Planctomycetaceae bacterium]
MLLVIDNYDSFVHNLARYFQRLDQETVVVRNDQIDPPAVERLRPDALVLSPGPCTPTEAGRSLDIVRHFTGRLPILGVCLGHQTIAAALGGRIVRASEPRHGRASTITHDGRGIFAGLPSPLTIGRYHSLVVEPATLPSELLVTAHSTDGTIMALAHRNHPVIGVQFHPESILTEHGFAMLANFLRIASLPLPKHLPDIDAERPARASESRLPEGPVTF